MALSGLSNGLTVDGGVGPADPWIADNLRCGPLTEADRQRIAEGIEGCYRAAGLPWPDHLRWVRSPSELASVVAQSRPLIRRWQWQQRRQARMAGRWRTLRRWTGFLGLRVLAVLVALGLLVAVLWFWGKALSRYGGWPANPPPDGGTILALGFMAFVFALQLLGYAASWAWITAGSEIDQRREAPFQLAPFGMPLAANRMLLPENEFSENDGSPARGERLQRALAPIWHALWLAPMPRPAAEPKKPGLSVRQTVAHALPARPMVGWLAFRGLTVVCEPPLELHVEPVAGTYRLHNADGPAVVWGDAAGHQDHYLHGVRVPEHLFGPDVTIDDLHAEPNSEVRRVLIERMGWPAYIQRAGLTLLASAPDPGNGEHELRLYELPPELHEDRRLLTMVNGSPDRSGRRREYAELVPAGFDDPIAAAAWQYDCPPEVYRELLRRT
jgi:hypothetical protein